MKKTNDQPIKDVLKAMVDHYRLKGKLNQSRIRQIWQKLMGKTINTYTSDIKIIKNTLYISILSASLKQELSYDKEKIKRIVNEELGEAYIEKVVIS